MYGGEGAVTYFVRETTKCTWFTQIPVSIARSSGQANFGQQWSVQMSRAGDYLCYTWLRTTIPDIQVAVANTAARWCHNLGHSLIREAAVSFNDLVAMRFDNFFLDFYTNFTIDASKRNGYNNMIGANIQGFSVDSTIAAYWDGVGSSASQFTRGRTLNIPLPYFFAADSGVALPAAALPYNDIRLSFEFRDWRQLLLIFNNNTQTVKNAVDSDVVNPANINLRDTNLWANYAIVSNDERKLMGCGGRDMLIQQVQTQSPIPFNPATIDSPLNMDVRFAHAVKALFFGVRNKTFMNDHGNYSTVSVDYTGVRPAAGNFNPLRRVALYYESTVRQEMDIDYYSLVNPFYHAVSIPTEPGYNMYSYSLNLTNLDPMGSTNYGKLTNATLRFFPSQAAIDGVNNNLPPSPDNIGAQSYEVFCIALNNNVGRISGGVFGFPIL